MAVQTVDSSPDPGPEREGGHLDRGVVYSFVFWLADDMIDLAPGDVRTMTFALRCRGEGSHQGRPAVRFEVIGIEASGCDRDGSACI